MISNTHVLVIILLLYVSLLNVLLVRVMYQRYVQPQLLASSASGTQHVTRRSNASTVRERVDACRHHAQRSPLIVLTFTDAVTESIGSPPYHDDHMRFLKQVRRALHGLEAGAVRVILMVTTDAFSTSLRTWCGDTSTSLACQLYLLEDALAYTVAAKLLHVAPCINDFVLLPSTVEIDVYFLPRLARTEAGTVTCLVGMQRGSDECLVPAFRAPKALMQVVIANRMHTWQTAAHALGNATYRQVVAPNLRMTGV